MLNYPEISRRPLTDVTRLLAHEGGHVLINARKTEETAGNRDEPDSEWRWILKCLAALAITELRIEHGLVDSGFPPAESATARDTEWNLRIVNAEVVNAICDPASQEVLVFRDAVLSTLNHLTKHLAYLAAPLLSGAPAIRVSDMSVLGQQNWDDYVAPVWDAKLRLLGRYPPVTRTIDFGRGATFLRCSSG